MLLSLARSELTQRGKARNREGSWSHLCSKMLFTICDLREINSRRSEVCAINSDTLKSLGLPKVNLPIIYLFSLRVLFSQLSVGYFQQFWFKG